MTNLEYLKKIKKDSYIEHIEVKDFDCRKILALEIIAEELCIYNKIHTGKTYWDWKKEEDEKHKT